MINIERWLDDLGLSQYADLFAEQEVDHQVLGDLTERDLEKLGIPLGPRKKLLRAIRSLDSGAGSEAPTRDGSPPVAAPSPAVVDEAERRQLTVMFCDLVGSTALSSGMDPEDFRELVQAFQEICAAAISRYEGFIARYMGDGLLVYFGYPQAHEDDAERALRTGLRIVDTVRGLPRHGAGPMQARIGIATGHVVAGDLIGEGAAEERAVLGDAPNLAARLQSQAEPGSVLIAPSTRRLADRLFEYEDAGRHELKGFPEPVQTWRLVGEASSESRFAATRSPGDRPLVGRESEVLMLLDRWERANEAEGQVVILSGEPGIGKSRLAHTLRGRIGRDAHTALQFQCSPYHANSAFYPFIENLQRSAGLAPNDSPERKFDKLEAWLLAAHEPLDEGAPLLGALLSISVPERYPPLDLSAERHKEKTVELLTRRLHRLARRAPLLAVFEDVHWADPTTLDVLGVVIDATPGAAMLLVVTHRPEFVSPWQGRGHVTAHSLTRLGKRQVASIVDDVTHGKSLPDPLLREIVAKTDGVPLFVEELTKTVLEAGFLDDEGERYALTGPLPPLSVPSTLRDSLVARLDRLGAVKSVAQLASAIGREFSYELLAAVSPLEDSDLESALGQLESAELIYRRGSPPLADYSFKHALVQDAAYDSLLRRRRERLHAELAAALESRFPETVSQEPELLAHHHTAAGQSAQAMHFRQAAARRALHRSAYPEALAHFDSALRLLAATSSLSDRRERELELQIARAGALMATRGYLAPETEAALARGQELARELGDTRQSFTASRGLHGIHFVRAELDEALSVARECLRMAQTGSDTQPASLAHRLIGQTLCMQGALGPAREHLERARDLDVGSGSEEIAALVHGGGHRLMTPAFLAHVRWLQGFPDEALALAQEGLAKAREQFGAFTVAASMFFLCWIHAWRGEFDTLEELVERQHRLAREHDISEWVSPGELLGDWARLAEGEPGERSALARLRLEAVRTLPRLRRPFKLGLLADALAADGSDDAFELIEEALAIAHQSGEGWSEAELLRIKSRTLLGNQEPLPAAENCLQQSLDIARAQGARAWELRTSTTLSRLWAGQGKRAQARKLLAPVYERFTEGLDTADLREARSVLDAVE